MTSAKTFLIIDSVHGYSQRFTAKDLIGIRLYP